jgi:hypothetical protein
MTTVFPEIRGSSLLIQHLTRPTTARVLHYNTASSARDKSGKLASQSQSNTTKLVVLIQKIACIRVRLPFSSLRYLCFVPQVKCQQPTSILLTVRLTSLLQVYYLASY